MSGRGGLLDQIHKGKKLKKTVTVDKSKPLLGGDKPSSSGGGGGGGGGIFGGAPPGLPSASRAKRSQGQGFKPPGASAMGLRGPPAGPKRGSSPAIPRRAAPPPVPGRSSPAVPKRAAGKPSAIPKRGAPSAPKRALPPPPPGGSTPALSPPIPEKGPETVAAPAPPPPAPPPPAFGGAPARSPQESRTSLAGGPSKMAESELRGRLESSIAAGDCNGASEAAIALAKLNQATAAAAPATLNLGGIPFGNSFPPESAEPPIVPGTGDDDNEFGESDAAAASRGKSSGKKKAKLADKQRKFQSEARRVKTFEVDHPPGRGIPWPHQHPTPAECAAAGFFFNPTKNSQQDRVTCYSCGKHKFDWIEGDDARLAHIEVNKDCSEVKSWGETSKKTTVVTVQGEVKEGVAAKDNLSAKEAEYLSMLTDEQRALLQTIEMTPGQKPKASDSPKPSPPGKEASRQRSRSGKVRRKKPSQKPSRSSKKSEPGDAAAGAAASDDLYHGGVPIDDKWIQYETEEGVPYWFNSSTQETTWEHPRPDL